MSRVRLVVAALLLLPVGLEAQITRPRPRPQPPVPGRPVAPKTKPQPPKPIAPRPDTGRAQALPAPTVRADTVGSDTTAHWSPPDSVMQSLLNKPGYTVTRYEGDVVTFDALTKAFAIAAAAARKAQVEREGQRVVTDSTIVYGDRTRTVNVSGNFQIVPGANQAPIAGTGTANYNLAERSGRLTNATVTVEESGASWFIRSEIGKTALGDSTRHIPPRFYGVGGSLTSCDDSIPDYHFQLKEIKRTEKTLVARPAVLYIRDIPVMWLPFVFQDIRPGRRSGVLPMRVGVSDIVRNNPGYRRHIENIGYYWAFSDYMDLASWVDWRSAAGGDSLDPGWYVFNAESKYNWMSRFLQGRFATAYTSRRDGSTNLAISWTHQHRLGRDRRYTMDANYVTSTRLQRQTTLNPYQAVATIRSAFNYNDKIGPASLQLGGSRVQYPGRQQVDQQLPSISVTTGPLAVASWLTWTPTFNFRESDNLHIDQPGTFSNRFVPGTDGRLVDTVAIKRNRFYREMTIGSPIRVFGVDFANNLTIRDALNDFPEEKVVYPNADSTQKQTRVFRRTFRTDVDWNPSFTLPSLAPNRFKLTPTVALTNVDPNPFWVRTEQSGGRFVHQSKRLVYGVSAAPTIFGLWPGFGPFTRIRHAVSPVITYNYAPRANVSNAYLEATGQRRQGYLGTLTQSAVSLSLSQNFEAKVRGAQDTASASGSAANNKIKLLSMQFSSLTYDFERAKFTGRKLAGLTTEHFGTRMTSDLLPGFDVSVDYSLFQGSTLSDTALFKPFLTRVASTFRISQRENPFTVITRLFGRAVSERRPDADAGMGLQSSRADDALARQVASQPVAGQAARQSQFVTTPGKGWEASFNFSTSRSRPPRGDRVINFDPRERCNQFQQINPFAYEVCINAPIADEPIPSTTAGAPYVQLPRQTSLSSSMNFELTQKWAAAWQTSYDFERRQFASQIVSLQRDLHDWRAVFAFTHSPNGNFAFNFFIALKPQPELKFDYSRATIRSQ